MDETRLKAVQMALELGRGAFASTKHLLESAREIENYLRGRDDNIPPK